MAFYFAPMADGLGDLLITLPALEALISTGVETYLVIRSPKQEGMAACIPGLSGSLIEPDFLALDLKQDDRYINLRAHPMFLNNVLGSKDFVSSYGNQNIFDVFESSAKKFITEDLGIDWNFEKYNPLPFKLKPELENTILFIPGSAGEFKCWSKNKWLDLYDRLKSKNLNCVVLGQPEKSKACAELVDAGITWLATLSLSDAIDIVSSAKAMVSVDTGLMHLSAQQGKPTVGLFLERSQFIRREPHFIAVKAPDCVDACLKWLDAKPENNPDFPEYEECTFYDCLASEEQRCMNFISVENVISALFDLSANFGDSNSASRI